MKKQFSFLCLMLALGALLFSASTGYCYREKPEDVIEGTCTNGVKKLLITYDTEHGTTALVAKQIYDDLCAADYSVDLVFVENLDPAELLNYDGLIIGSPIYSGPWLPGIKKLMKRHHADIAKVPTAFFITCTTVRDLTTDNESNATYQEAIKYFMDPQLDKYHDIVPVSKKALAGGFQFSELFPVQIFLMKLMKYPEGDFRKPALIDAWADDLADAFK
jgi:menaquinone-dependent protoporphyrinogen oxidase